MSQQYDLVVLGLGSAGTLAARFAADDLGLRVAAVERDRVGGDCLWTGCVPSKAMLASSRAAHAVRRAKDHGISTGAVEIDRAAVWSRIHAIRDEIARTDDDPERYREAGIDMIQGLGRVTGAREVSVDTADGVQVLTTRFVLVCTGSRPASPAIAGLDRVPYLTTDQLYELDEPPESVVIVGGGPVAVETAQALARLDVVTSVVAASARLLPRDEPELTDRLAAILRADGVDLHLGSRVTELRGGSDGPVSVHADGLDVAASSVLLATGRTANVEHLGLETFGIRTGPSGIAVDGRSRTIVPTIYAVGDVAAERPRFTHAAAQDAVLAVRDMFFPGRGLANRLVPWCTYTDPELAHVGLTAAEARERYGSRRVEVHRHELSDNDRARADGTTDGALLIVTAKDRIVGAHSLGPSAGESIHELSLAITLGLKLSDLGDVVHLYPTYATGIAQIVADRMFRTGRRYRAIARFSRRLG